MKALLLIAYTIAALADDPALNPAIPDNPKVPTGTLVVANMADNSISLIDTSGSSPMVRLDAVYAPHEVALSADGRLAAVTNYGGQDEAGNVIQIVGIEQGTVLRELTIEGHERIHGVAFWPNKGQLCATSEKTGEVLMIDSLDGTIRSKRATKGRGSHMLAIGGNWIYTANAFDGTISGLPIDSATTTKVWPSEAGARTEGIAATRDGREVWTGSMQSGTVVGLESASGLEVARIEGLAVPYRLAIGRDQSQVFVSDPGSQKLVIISREHSMVDAVIDMGAASAEAGLGKTPSPQGLFISPDGEWAFVSTKAIHRVALVHLRSRKVVRFMESGMGPDGLAFTTVSMTRPK